MATCNHCGSFVTTDYVRVFGDNEGTVHGCPECMALRHLMAGMGAVSADAEAQEMR